MNILAHNNVTSTLQRSTKNEMTLVLNWSCTWNQKQQIKQH